MRRFSLTPASALTARTTIRNLSLFVLLCSAGFAQSTAPVPQIGNPLVPMAVLPGSDGFSLTINGTGFVSGSTVYWNGNSRSTTFVSSGQLIAAIPASDVATVTSGSVTVHNPGGTISNVVLLLVTNPVAAPFFGATEVPLTTNEGSGYYGMLAGDYDGNGFADVAVNTGLVLEVMPGNGDGSFQYPATYTIPGARDAYGGVLADFNNDGTLDFLFSNETTNSVDIFLSNRDGSLQPPLQDSIGSSYVISAAGDFNGDGKRDLTFSVSGGVGVMFGNGDGTFGAITTLHLLNGANSVAVGDFNRDGILDIAAGNAESGGGGHSVLSIMLGRHDGTFDPHVDYQVGRDPDAIAVGDLNGDGYPDIAIVDIGVDDTPIYVFLNKGDGTFLPPVKYSGAFINSYFRSLAMGDFNGDGKLDLAAYDEEGFVAGDIQIFAGNGDGTLQAPVAYGTRQDHGGFLWGDMAVADLNHDGKLDIATPTGNGPYVMVQTSGPAATITPGPLSFAPQIVGTQSQPQGIYMIQPGSTTITMSNATTTGDFEVPPGFNCVLPPGNTGSCNIAVTFSPTATGTRTGSLAIVSSGGTQYVSLTGIGATGAIGVTVSPSSLSFPTQTLATLSPYQSVLITNTGTSTLDLTSIALTGASPGDFALANSCASTVVPGANCIVQIASQPTQRGARTAILSITDNASNSPQTIPLSGIGTTNSLSASSLNFGGVAVGVSSEQTVTLTNVGISATMIGKVSIAGTNSGDYTQSNDCGTSLAAKSSCAFSVTFTPTVKGVRKASLTFASNGTGAIAPTTILLAGTGK